MSLTKLTGYVRALALLAIPAAGAIQGAALPAERYALILDEAPVARTVSGRTALNGPAAQARRERILRAQATLRAALGRLGATPTGAVDTLLNAVFVATTPDRVAALRALPGVAAAAPMGRMHRSLSTALDVVNTNAAWSALGGQANAGAGVKIAVLDTGVDETHPGLKDSAMKAPAGYPRSGNADDALHTTGKVIVARSFVAALASGYGTPESSRPDDLSARDRVGHGTAVAMIAAGALHTSPLGSISGVAPKAWLGNYKIFGSPGVNDSTTADVALTALEWAFKDGMDVAILASGDPPSLWSPEDQGATCGQPAGAACDPWAAAVSAALKSGMAVVAAAGNRGETGLHTIASPANVTDAIAVGATSNSHTVAAALITPAGDRLAMRFSDGPQPGGAFTAPMIPAAAVSGAEYGCAAFPAGSLAGKVVLMSDGFCSYPAKVLNAWAAGAAAAIVFPLATGGTLGSPIGLENTGIPSAQISNASGVYLRGYLAANPNARVTLDPTKTETGAATVDAVAPFSSRGPGTQGLGIKPDLAAPGVSIYTAAQNLDPNGDLYSASRYVGVDGTSFAAAFAGGAAALVKQAHPGWTASQIKSALVNTASATVTDGSSAARTTAVGAGRLDIAAAVKTTVTVEPSSISFGAIGASLAPRTVSVTNLGSSQATLQLKAVARDASATTVTVTPASLTLAAGQSQTVTLNLGGSLPAPGSYEGYLEIAGGPATLRAPWLYLASDGVPASLIPLQGAGFVTETSSAVNLAVLAIDKYGVPVTNAQIRFAPADSVYRATPATDPLGIAEAYMMAPATAGEAAFRADLLVNAARADFSGHVRKPPQIAKNGVVDSASFQSGAGFAPGSYVTIFGDSLAEALTSATTASLPISLAGVSISFDDAARGVHAPGRLVLVAPGQVNLQVPLELAGSTSAVMKVTLANSASRSVRQDNVLMGTYQSQTVTIPIASYSPAFFEYTDAGGARQAAALDESYRVIGSATPVARGRVAQFYLNGLGPVTQTVASGERAPGGDGLALTQTTPTVTIGGRPAQVLFSGLAPYLVGLYQVNVVVPESAPAGLQPVSLSIGGVTAPNSQLAVAQ